MTLTEKTINCMAWVMAVAVAVPIVYGVLSVMLVAAVAVVRSF